MKLSSIAKPINESLPVWSFAYPAYETDPNPKVVVLGMYDNPNTGNKLIVGINVRLLSPTATMKLVGMASDLKAINGTKSRVRMLRQRASRIFDNAFRTYDSEKIHDVKKDILKVPTIDPTPTLEPKTKKKSQKSQQVKVEPHSDKSQESQKTPKTRPEQNRKQQKAARIETPDPRDSPERTSEKPPIVSPNMNDSEY